MSEGDDGPEELPDNALPTERATVDAGSRKGYRKQELEVETRRKASLAFWAGVFADPVGRSEMWALLKEAGTFEQRFACGPNGFPQAEATWFAAGQKALGQRLHLQWLRDHREAVGVMHDEHDPYFARPQPAKKAKPSDG